MLRALHSSVSSIRKVQLSLPVDLLIPRCSVRTAPLLSSSLSPSKNRYFRTEKQNVSLEEALQICGGLLENPGGLRGEGLTAGRLMQYLNNVIIAANKENCDTFIHDGRFHWLIDKVSGRLLSFTPAEMYYLIVTLSRMQACPEKLLLQILEELLHLNQSAETLSVLSNSQLSSLILIISHVNVSEECSTKLQDFASQYCVQLVQGLRKVMNVSRDNQDDHEEAAATRSSDIATDVPLTLKDCSFIVLGLSNMGVRNFEALHTIADYLVEHFLSANSESTAYGSLDKRVVQSAIEGPQLSTLFLAFSTLGLKNPPFYQALAYRLTEYIDMLAPPHLANIMLAFATLSRDIDFPLLLVLLKDLESALCAKWRLFNGTDALCTCWSVCCIEMHKSKPDLIINFVKRMSEDRDCFSLEQKKQLHQIALTVLLDGDDARQKATKKELEEALLWEFIFQPEKELAEECKAEGENNESTECIREVSSTLRIREDLASVIRSATGNVGIETSEIYVQTDHLIENFYRVPIAIIATPYSSKSSDTTYIEQLKMCIEMIPDEFLDFEAPLDPFISMKHRHLRQMGWLVAGIKVGEYLSLPSKDAKIDYLCRLFDDVARPQ